MELVVVGSENGCGHIAQLVQMAALLAMAAVASCAKTGGMQQGVPMPDPDARELQISIAQLRSLGRHLSGTVGKLKASPESRLKQPVPSTYFARAQTIIAALEGRTTSDLPHAPRSVGGRYENTFGEFSFLTSVNNPFISAVNDAPFETVNLVDAVRAGAGLGNQKGGFQLDFVDGSVAMRPAGRLNVYEIMLTCESVTYMHSDGGARSVLNSTAFRYLRSIADENAPRAPLVMRGRHRPVLCAGGTGEVFRGATQPMRRELSTREDGVRYGRDYSFGTVKQERLNDGVSLLNMSADQIKAFETLYDASIASEYARKAREVVNDAEANFIEAKDMFDNVAFFALSTIALISSVAAVVVSSRPTFNQAAAIGMETVVVYVFLAFVAHVYAVLTRRVSFSVLMFSDDASHYSVNDTLDVDVSAFSVSSVVGVRNSLPSMVLASLIVSMLATLTVTVALAINLRKIWKKSQAANAAVAKKLDRSPADYFHDS